MRNVGIKIAIAVAALVFMPLSVAADDEDYAVSISMDQIAGEWKPVEIFTIDNRHKFVMNDQIENTDLVPTLGSGYKNATLDEGDKLTIRADGTLRWFFGNSHVFRIVERDENDYVVSTAPDGTQYYWSFLIVDESTMYVMCGLNEYMGVMAKLELM